MAQMFESAFLAVKPGVEVEKKDSRDETFTTTSASFDKAPERPEFQGVTITFRVFDCPKK